MSKVFLICDDDDLAQFFSVNINMYTGSNIVIKSNLRSAFEYLENNISQLDVIVSVAFFQNKIDAGFKTFTKLQKMGSMLPLIIIGDDPNLPDNVKILDSNLKRKPLIQEIAKLLEITAQKMVQKTLPKFYPIPLEYFYHFDHAPCDIFHLLKISAGQLHYIKKYSRHDEIFKTDLRGFENQYINTLHIPSEDRLRFTESISRIISSKLRDRNLHYIDHARTLSSALTNVSEQIQDLGITHTVIEVTQYINESFIRMCERSPTLKILISMLVENIPNYRYNHAQICSYICIYIVKNTEWGSHDQIIKLAFVCLFHDITLVETRLAKVRSEEELNAPSFTEKEKETVRSHANKVLRLLREFPKLPLGVDVVIKQHHGVATGYGFTHHYAGDISPLAIIFIIAQDFTDRLMESDINEFDPHKAIDEMYAKFRSTRYKKIIDLLSDIIL